MVTPPTGSAVAPSVTAPPSAAGCAAGAAADSGPPVLPIGVGAGVLGPPHAAAAAATSATIKDIVIRMAVS